MFTRGCPAVHTALFIKLGKESYYEETQSSIFHLVKVHPDDMKQAWTLGFLGKPRKKMNPLSSFRWKPNRYIKSPTRAEEVAQWVKPLLLKHEERCLDPQNSGKHLVGAAATCQLRTWEAEGRSPWSKLADGTSWPWWTLGSERDPTLLNKTDCNWGRHQGPLWASTGMQTYVLLYLNTCMPHIFKHICIHTYTQNKINRKDLGIYPFLCSQRAPALDIS